MAEQNEESLENEAPPNDDVGETLRAERMTSDDVQETVMNFQNRLENDVPPSDDVRDAQNSVEDETGDVENGGIAADAKPGKVSVHSNTERSNDKKESIKFRGDYEKTIGKDPDRLMSQFRDVWSPIRCVEVQPEKEGKRGIVVVIEGDKEAVQSVAAYIAVHGLHLPDFQLFPKRSWMQCCLDYREVGEAIEQRALETAVFVDSLILSYVAPPKNMTEDFTTAQQAAVNIHMIVSWWLLVESIYRTSLYLLTICVLRYTWAGVVYSRLKIKLEIKNKDERSKRCCEKEAKDSMYKWMLAKMFAMEKLNVPDGHRLLTTLYDLITALANFIETAGHYMPPQAIRAGKLLRKIARSTQKLDKMSKAEGGAKRATLHEGSQKCDAKSELQGGTAKSIVFQDADGLVWSQKELVMAKIINDDEEQPYITKLKDKFLGGNRKSASGKARGCLNVFGQVWGFVVIAAILFDLFRERAGCESVLEPKNNTEELDDIYGTNSSDAVEDVMNITESVIEAIQKETIKYLFNTFDNPSLDNRCTFLVFLINWILVVDLFINLASSICFGDYFAVIVKQEQDEKHLTRTQQELKKQLKQLPEGEQETLFQKGGWLRSITVAFLFDCVHSGAYVTAVYDLFVIFVSFTTYYGVPLPSSFVRLAKATIADSEKNFIWLTKKLDPRSYAAYEKFQMIHDKVVETELKALDIVQDEEKNDP